MFWILCLVGFVIPTVIMVWCMYKSPRGYEDADGFHYDDIDGDYFP